MFILVVGKVEHTLHNEDERLRLRHLGHNGEQLGGHNFTRCFGNYLVKVVALLMFLMLISLVLNVRAIMASRTINQQLSGQSGHTLNFVLG